MVSELSELKSIYVNVSSASHYMQRRVSNRFLTSLVRFWAPWFQEINPQSETCWQLKEQNVESKFCEEHVRDRGIFTLEKGKLRNLVTAIFKYWKGWQLKDRTSVFPGALEDRT